MQVGIRRYSLVFHPFICQRTFYSPTTLDCIFCDPCCRFWFKQHARCIRWHWRRRCWKVHVGVPYSECAAACAFKRTSRYTGTNFAGSGKFAQLFFWPWPAYLRYFWFRLKCECKVGQLLENICIRSYLERKKGCDCCNRRLRSSKFKWDFVLHSSSCRFDLSNDNVSQICSQDEKVADATRSIHELQQRRSLVESSLQVCSTGLLMLFLMLAITVGRVGVKPICATFKSSGSWNPVSKEPISEFMRGNNPCFSDWMHCDKQ